MEVFIIILISFGLYIILNLISKSLNKTSHKEQPSRLFPSESKPQKVGAVGKSKIFMCIKDVKWALESMPPTDRAYILAMVTFYRIKIIETTIKELDFPENILREPIRQSENNLYSLYTVLEKGRNNNTYQREQTEKNLKNLGMPMKEYAKGHAIAAERAIEVWMCTVGLGISPNKKNDVIEIWELLINSVDLIDDSIEKIYEFLDRVTEDTGVNDYETMEMFTSLDKKTWKEESYFTPDFIKK